MTEPTKIDRPNDQHQQKKPKSKLFWINVSMVCVVVVLVGLIYGYKQFQSFNLVHAYNKDFNQISAAAALFSDKVAKEPENMQSFNELVDYYQKLKAENNFDAQIRDLNNNPRYGKFNDKKDASALALNKPEEELDRLLKDIDQIQLGFQKSKDIDNEIHVLETTTTTISDFDAKTDKLTTLNDEIKEDMLGIVVHPNLKMSESKAANLAYLDGLSAQNEQKRQVQLARKYINDGNNSFYSDTYYGMANEANQLASDQNQLASEKFSQHKLHKQEAAKLLATYSELMGDPSFSIPEAAAVNTDESAQNDSDQTISTDSTESIIVADQQIEDLMKAYIETSVAATQDYDFSNVSPYVDPNGKLFKEGKKYLQYLESKGIKEQLISVEVTSIERLGDKEYHVYTEETYDISYADGTTKTKSFRSTFLVVEDNNNLFVNSLIETNEFTQS
jgi:hypothetical protein